MVAALFPAARWVWDEIGVSQSSTPHSQHQACTISQSQSFRSFLGKLGRIYTTDCAGCGSVAAVAAERGRGPGQSYSSDPTLHWARLLICATRPGQAVITAGRCRTTNELILNELRNTAHRSPRTAASPINLGGSSLQIQVLSNRSYHA